MDYAITQDSIDTYADIAITDKQAANAFAAPIIAALGLATPAERGRAWDQIKAAVKAPAPVAKKRAPAKAKSEISKACKSILATTEITWRESEFLNSIKAKRKLTPKQELWLRDLARKVKVEVGTIENKASPRTSKSTNCDHGDLGSMGYTHGETVKCPNCGSLAEVW